VTTPAGRGWRGATFALSYANRTDLVATGMFVSSDGAVGVDNATDGVVSNSTFLTKFNNSTAADGGIGLVCFLTTMGSPRSLSLTTMAV